jgi:predicted FMN-binding regulatory protein PaiB
MAAPKKGSKSSGPITRFKVKAKVSRKGIHAKTKMSKNKGSKNYVKVSRGQG